MQQWRRGDSLIERFCAYMSRRHPLAGLGDIIGGMLLSPGMQLALAGGRSARGPSRHEDMSKVYMAIGPMPENNKGPAPTTPMDPVTSWWDRPGNWDWLWNSAPEHARRKRAYDEHHTSDSCMDDRYHGMHGRPCKFEGGSDTKCPAGTVSGWYWSYDCPTVGKVYYIDCCGGGTPKGGVWCGWSREDNWCFGFGKAAMKTPPVQKYFCTLSVLDIDMRTTAVPGGFEVVGVDP